MEFGFLQSSKGSLIENNIWLLVQQCGPIRAHCPSNKFWSKSCKCQNWTCGSLRRRNLCWRMFWLGCWRARNVTEPNKGFRGNNAEFYWTNINYKLILLSIRFKQRAKLWLDLFSLEKRSSSIWVDVTVAVGSSSLPSLVWSFLLHFWLAYAKQNYFFFDPSNPSLWAAKGQEVWLEEWNGDGWLDGWNERTKEGRKKERKKG